MAYALQTPGSNNPNWRTHQKRLFALAALFFLPVAAHANGAPRGIEPVRTQIRQAAKQNGYFTSGSGESLRLGKEQNGEVKVTILTKSAILPGQQATRHPIAEATFKLTSAVDGAIATPVKADGQAFQRLLQAR